MTELRSGTRPGAAVAVTALALGVDMFLYGSIVPLLPTLPAVDGSPLIAGLLFAVYAFALLAATPFVGVWVDRRGPRAPMLVGLLGLAAATVLFASAVDIDGTAGLTLLFLARGAQGIAAAASWTSGLALIAATHEPERRGRVMGLALSAVGVGVLLGPAVSGLLSDAWGPHAPFLVIAVFAAADAVARIVLVKETPAREVRTPYRVVLRGPRVGLLIALTGLGAAAIAFPEPVLPLHLSDLGLGTTGIGLVFAAAALGGSLAAPVAGLLTDRVGATRVASCGALVAALGFFLTGRDSTVWSVTGLIVVGFGAQLVLAPTLVLIGVLAEHTKPAAYGAAYALYNLAYTGGLAVAPLVAGATAKAAGVPTTTLVACGLAVAVAVVLLARRDQPAADSTGSTGSTGSTDSAKSPEPAWPGSSTDA
ncbi:Predicted arabinose efflux permease, MFS family [Streptomyces sp. yr375]|uniref:MFS transporter n=1 Tax=Streptomyces sp. yr375 TaxID=1761906 RepID=UPI0008C9FDA2|nr:MFS transporter [Streptomyces sp. yr375]SER48392.1 Predicted arabinose efflux permease, MFS family [Streptomyces sp. yr375]